MIFPTSSFAGESAGGEDFDIGGLRSQLDLRLRHENKPRRIRKSILLIEGLWQSPYSRKRKKAYNLAFFLCTPRRA